MQKTERAPEGARPPYTCVTLERIADADGEVLRIGAGKERLGTIVVVRRRYAVLQERTDRVNEGLPIEAPARARVPLCSPQACGAAGARSERAVALACADELRRKAPRAEAAVPTDRVVVVLVGGGFRCGESGGRGAFFVLQPRGVGDEAHIWQGPFRAGGGRPVPRMRGAGGGGSWRGRPRPAGSPARGILLAPL